MIPAISYAAAHRWEPLAKAKGVSAVARSSRGFMRAYEAAGTWGRPNAYLEILGEEQGRHVSAAGEGSVQIPDQAAADEEVVVQ